MIKYARPLALALAVLALLVGSAACATGELGITNFNTVWLSDALKVGPGTPDVALDGGGDGFFADTLEVDGDAQFDGDVQFAGALTGVITVTNDMNGGILTMDADADTTLAAAVDDVLVATVGAATGLFNVLVGNLKVGNGTPTLTLGGEDGYVEGTFEVDGITQLDGGLDLNGSDLTIDADADTILDEVSDDNIRLTSGAAGGLWNVLTGNLKVGNGTPGNTLDGEDLYVEGGLEVDGATRLDGAVDLNGVVTSAANLEHMFLPTYATASFTYTAAAGGTVPLFTIGAGETWLIEDIRVEVTTNFDATGDDATVTIGDGADPDGFCVLADTELQTADTEGTGWEAGWQCQVAATRGVYIDGTGGFIYDDASAESIDAVIGETSGTTLAAGAATVHLWYTRIQ